jgi:hypothetical protein
LPTTLTMVHWTNQYILVRSLELYKTENLSKKLKDSSLLFETLIVDGHVD